MKDSRSTYQSPGTHPDPHPHILSKEKCTMFMLLLSNSSSPRSPTPSITTEWKTVLRQVKIKRNLNRNMYKDQAEECMSNAPVLLRQCFIRLFVVLRPILREDSNCILLPATENWLHLGLDRPNHDSEGTFSNSHCWWFHSQVGPNSLVDVVVAP